MSERRLRVFLVGLYGVDNVGDDAIRLAVERAAGREGAVVYRYATRRAVPDPRAVCLRRAPLCYLRAIRACDRVAIGGGGLLKDEGHALLRGYGVLLELLATALAARALHKQVVLLAVGAGPIHTRRGRRLVSVIARLADVRQVRDEDSAATLRALGVERVEVAVDPTFSFLDEQAAPAGAAPATEHGHAVLSVRHWFVYDSGRQRREGSLQAAFAAAADVLAGAGCEPRFAPLYWPRDRDAAAAAIARMAMHETAQPLAGPLAWEPLARELRDARLLVAMRYHAIACAAIAGCPIVAVAYEPKVAALAGALGLPFLHVEDPELERRLPQLVALALADPDAHRPDPERLRALAHGARAGLRRVLGSDQPPSSQR
jgi:polysaccharide pyruvyl transferase WcaK-like protein